MHGTNGNKNGANSFFLNTKLLNCKKMKTLSFEFAIHLFILIQFEYNSKLKKNQSINFVRKKVTFGFMLQ